MSIIINIKYIVCVSLIFMHKAENKKIKKDVPFIEDKISNIRIIDYFVEYLKVSGEASTDHLKMFYQRELYDNFMADFKSTDIGRYELYKMEPIRAQYYTKKFRFNPTPGSKQETSTRKDILNEPKISEREEFCTKTRPLKHNLKKQKYCLKYYPKYFPFLTDFTNVQFIDKGHICTIEFLGMQQWEPNVFQYEHMIMEMFKPRIVYRADRMKSFVFLRPTPANRFLFDFHELEDHEIFIFELKPPFQFLLNYSLPLQNFTATYSYFACKSGLFSMQWAATKAVNLTITFRITSKLGLYARVYWYFADMNSTDRVGGETKSEIIHVPEVQLTMEYPGVYFFYAVCVDHRDYFNSNLEGPIIINLDTKLNYTGPVVGFDLGIYATKVHVYFSKPMDPEDLPPVYIIVLHCESGCTHYYDLRCDDCDSYLDDQVSLDYQVETLCPNGKENIRNSKTIPFSISKEKFKVTIENLRINFVYKLSIIPVNNALPPKVVSKQFRSAGPDKSKQYDLMMYIAFFFYLIVTCFGILISFPIIQLYMKRKEQMDELSKEKNDETDLEFINYFKLDEEDED